MVAGDRIKSLLFLIYMFFAYECALNLHIFSNNFRSYVKTETERGRASPLTLLITQSPRVLFRYRTTNRRVPNMIIFPCLQRMVRMSS